MCVGSSDVGPNNSDRLEGFNCDAKMRGSCVRVLLGSRVIGESRTLNSVRQFYFLTPHCNGEHGKVMEALHIGVRDLASTPAGDTETDPATCQDGGSPEIWSALTHATASAGLGCHAGTVMTWSSCDAQCACRGWGEQ